MSRGRIHRGTEIRFLHQYKSKIKDQKVRKSIKCVRYIERKLLEEEKVQAKDES